jgi:hypothetical protein
MAKLEDKLPETVISAIKRRTFLEPALDHESKPFFVASMSEVDRLCNEWKKQLPDIVPFYGEHIV